MSPRGSESRLNDFLHRVDLAVMCLFLLLAMGYGVTLLGKRFRCFSYATGATLVVFALVFGALSIVDTGALAAHQPTPWLGIPERVSIYAAMLWLAMLAVALLRAPGARRARSPNGPLGRQHVEQQTGNVTAQPMLEAEMQEAVPC